MDFEKLTTPMEWIKKCESSTDLSIILIVSMIYADSHEKKHTTNQMIELYKVCHKMACLLKDKTKATLVCIKIALLYLQTQRLNHALHYLKKHMSMFKETGNLEEEGSLYFIIGGVYYLLEHYEKAMEYYKKALTIFQETGNIAEEGRWYGHIGSLYESLGQYEKAMEYHKKSLSISQRIGNISTEGASYDNIGNVYYSLRQYQKAMEYHKKALSIHQRIGDIAEEGTAYSNIGNVYYSLGHYEKAMEFHKKCLSICQRIGDIAGEGTSYNNIGSVYDSLGQYEKAMEYGKKALSIHQRTGDLPGEGTSYNNTGSAYKSLGQYEKAMECHKKALSIRQRIGDIPAEGRSYGNIGKVYHSLGHYEKSMEYYKKSLTIFQKTGNIANEGTSYGNIGSLYESLGQYEKAMEYLKKGLSISQRTGDISGEGRAYGSIGSVYNSLGQYEKAMEYLKESLSISQRTGDISAEGASYGIIGSVYSSLGQNQKAMEYHKKALSICQRTGDLAGEGSSYNNIGIVHNSLGYYEDSMKYLEKGLSIQQRIGNIANEGSSYNNIGDLYYQLGQYDRAMECHKKSLSISQRIGDLAGEGTSYGNIGHVYHRQGEFAEAMKYYEKDLSICQRIGNLASEGHSYSFIGVVYYSLSQYEKAMEYHKIALSISQRTGNLKEEGWSYGCIGVVYSSLSQYEKAMEYCKKALSMYQRIGEISQEGQWYHKIGVLRYKNGDFCGSEASLKESLRCSQEIFKLLHQQDDFKVSIVDTYVHVYHLLTKVLLLCGKEKEALLVSERGRSQALRDKLVVRYGLQKGEEDNELLDKDIDSFISSNDSSFMFLSLLQDKLCLFVMEQGKELYLREMLPGSFAFCANSDCSSTVLQDLLKSYVNKMLKDANKYLSTPRNSCENRSMDEHQDNHPLQHLALDKILSADDVESVTGIKEELLEENVFSCVSSYSREPVDHKDKNSSIGEHQSKRAQGSQQGTDQNVANAFEKLHQVLIAPVQDQLTKPEIVIIPDGPFFFVPFAALKDKSGHFLSETKRIRLGSSLTTLKLLKECPAEKHCKTGALIVGGPVAEDVMYRGKMTTFDDLPFARKEARKIGWYLGVKSLTKYSATKDEVMERLQEGVSIIHIATHGNATTGELVLSPGQCDDDEEIPKEKDYMLTLKEIYSSRINAQLVVLSCCHSGLGKIRAEGVVGLTRAFLAAGARSVLASLWAIDDVAALYFMDAFYGHLTSGESASASLQQAMEKMRKMTAFSHPYYWAPFFIIGDDIKLPPKMLKNKYLESCVSHDEEND